MVEHRRTGLGYASLAVGAIGLLCCLCSILLAILPGALHSKPVHSVQEPHGSIQQLLSGSGLEALRLRLVDPDAQSDELEDPAILLDPNQLLWEGGEAANYSDTSSAEEGKDFDEHHEDEQDDHDSALSSLINTIENDSVANVSHATTKTTSNLVVNSSRSERRPPKVGRPSRDTLTNYNCTLDQKLLDWTIRKIRDTPLAMDPYPHLYVPRIFEPRFYQNCLLPRLPPNEAYSPLPNNVDRTQIPFSGKFGFGPQTMNRVGRPDGELSEEKKAIMDVQFWTDFAKLFASKQMIKIWLLKFYPTTKHRNIMKRIQKFDDKQSFWYLMSLGRDVKGYSIGPHTDTADKWVTTLYYLPRHNRNPELGTVVVKSLSGQVSKGNMRAKLDGTDFVIAKQAPYVRNSLMAFSACEGSWHAVQKVDGAILRDTIQGFVSGQMYGGKQQCGKKGDPLYPPEAKSS